MDVRDEDFQNVNPGEPRVLIPEEGWYPAQFDSYEVKPYGRWGEKLIFHWKVFTSTDKATSSMLCRYYNMERDKGGRLKFGPLHDYRKDWVAANGGRHPLASSKLPPSIWRESLFIVQVVTVRHDSKGPLSPSFYWSKINRVIRSLAQHERWERLPLQHLNSFD